MHAIIGDLASPTVDDSLLSSDLFNFDIAVVGGGFHHFGDPELAAKRRKFFIFSSADYLTQLL
jgi:hypothetical protein